MKATCVGGFGPAAAYLKDAGQNESVRLVQISDPDAADLGAVFRNMWELAKHTQATKPLHHVSINPALTLARTRG